MAKTKEEIKKEIKLNKKLISKQLTCVRKQMRENSFPPELLKEKMNKLLAQRKELDKQRYLLDYVSKKHCMKYVVDIENKCAIFTTNQKNPVSFKVDMEDIDLVRKLKWEFHPYKSGDGYLVYRYKDDKGKWKTKTLLTYLGYNKNYTFQNGDKLDCRRSNIIMKRYIVDKIFKK